jgi:hypothetical protein
MNITDMNITNISFQNQPTMFVNGYNMGKVAALSQISHLLILVVVGLLVASFAPKFDKWAKTEPQKRAIGMAYEFGITMALTAALLALSLHFVNARVVVGL